jgi:hypothetical protein
VQAIEGFLKVGDELVVVFSLDNHIIHVGFNIAMQLVGETQLNGLLVHSPRVLQPEGYSYIGVCSKWGDECGLDLIFFLDGNLMVARVAIK